MTMWTETGQVPWTAADDEATAPVRPARHLWPLMGDISTARGGVPELLIQWRRAEGEDDPAPRL